MNTLHHIVAYFMDAMAPLARISLLLPLAVMAALMALTALAVYRYFSHQEALVSVKKRLTAYLLEFRLYQENIASVFPTFFRIIGGAAKYMALSLVPLAVLIVPIMLWIVHLSPWYEWRPLKVGESALLTLSYAGEAPEHPAPPTASRGLSIGETPFVSHSADEAVWTVTADQPVDGRAVWILNGQRITKRVQSGGDYAPVAPERLPVGSWRHALIPAEKTLPPKTGVRSIYLNYPERQLTIGKYRVHWLAALFVMTVAFGFVLKKPLGVEF